MKKRKLIPLPPKPTFAMTGIAVGVGTGLIAGFIAELTWRHSVLMMQAGGIAGITVGGIFEAARYRWRLRLFRALRKEAETSAGSRQ